MKVLQIINSLEVGGAEILLIEFTPLLRRNDVEIDILSLKEVKPEIVLYMKQKGVHVMSLKVKNIYHPIIIFHLLGYISDYDLIHVHLFPAQYWVAFTKLLKGSKKKFVTTEHNTTNRRRSIFFFRYVDWLVYALYDQIICISEKATDELVTYLASDNRVITVYNGIDIVKFEESSAVERTELKGVTADSVIITMVAGFRKQKDQDTLIKAMLLLPDTFHLVLVGNGERLEKCENLAEHLKIKERVHFLGIRNDIPQILKMSDIIVLSSYFEGLSLSSIEGMASGRPFVASDVDGLREVVHGAGLLFQRGNERELADILLRLSVDQSFAISVGNKCHSRAKEYDIKVMVNKYLSVYRGLCDK